MKYYVVWGGRAPGIYESWEECRLQTEGFPGARYKSFPTLEAATEAFRGDPADELAFARNLRRQLQSPPDYIQIPGIRLDAVAVDGACAGNPGPMEYRCVRVVDGTEIFRVGPINGGTNNIGEYLAIIHAAALLKQRGLLAVPIYSDSATAINWVRRRHSNTKLSPHPSNKRLFEMLDRADTWLARNGIANPLLKWNTEEWGEIPADFGRK